MAKKEGIPTKRRTSLDKYYLTANGVKLAKSKKLWFKSYDQTEIVKYLKRSKGIGRNREQIRRNVFGAMFLTHMAGSRDPQNRITGSLRRLMEKGYVRRGR